MKRILFEIPKWSLFLHRDARGLPSSLDTDDGLAMLGDELFERLYAGEPEPLSEAELHGEWKEWAQNIHHGCEQMPSFQRLCSEVRGDALAAGIAVEQLLQEVAPKLPEPDALPPPLPALRRMVNGGSEKAAAAVEQARESQEGLSGVGWGSGTQFATTQTPGASRTLASRLKGDARLRRIAQLAGRFKRIALAKLRAKVNHGADEITDIEQGADLGRLLPTELGRLIHPVQKLAFLRDLAERRCLQYQLTGTDSLGKGPMVVCLDKSGSMDGARDIWATAVALALLEVAHWERRPFALLCFDGAVKFETQVAVGGQLPESALFIGCAGGTQISAVLHRGLDLVREGQCGLRKSDIILVTDGGSDAEEAPSLRAEAGALGVSLLGVGIGVEAAVLQPWCDEVQLVRDLEGVSDEMAGKLFIV